MITTDTTEWDAISETIQKIKAFKTLHGVKALKDAITNGAFNVHPNYGDVTYVFKDKEYDHDMIDIPVWIHDLYSDVAEEDFY